MIESDFNKIIKVIKDVDKTYDKLYKMGIVICDNPIHQHVQYLYNYILKQEYGDEGCGWVIWYIYELPRLKNDNVSNHAWDANGNPIVLNNDNDLYCFLEANYRNGSNNICT